MTEQMIEETPPQSFEQLIDVVAKYHEDIVLRSDGRRWCWITEWSGDCDDGQYLLGIKVEGQTTWTIYCVLQSGFGRTAFQWVEKLNEREGISPAEHERIWHSGGPGAKACLGDDETTVLLHIQGVKHTVEFNENPLLCRCTFSLEWCHAQELDDGLHAIRKKLPLRHMNGRRVAVDEDELTGDINFIITGGYESDPNDEYCFTLTIDLETAAQLYAACTKVCY